MKGNNYIDISELKNHVSELESEVVEEINEVLEKYKLEEITYLNELEDHIVHDNDEASNELYKIDSEIEEAKEALEFLEDVEGFNSGGSSLILDDYFETHVKDWCDEQLSGRVPTWLVVEWDSTIDNFLFDYTEILWGGTAYLVRN